MKDITARAPTFLQAGQRRYTAAAQAFHWLTTLLVFTIVPMGWIFAEYKKPWGGGALYASIHKSLGLIVLALVIARLAYRFSNPPPRLPGRIAAWERGAAHLSHWLLYAVLLFMPISGYIMSAGGKHPISFFGLFDVPKLPISAAAAGAAETAHHLGQWALYALVILHIAATVWHLVVRRDDILGRMIPRQINAD